MTIQMNMTDSGMKWPCMTRRKMVQSDPARTHLEAIRAVPSTQTTH